MYDYIIKTNILTCKNTVLPVIDSMRYIDRDSAAAEKLLWRLEARPEFRLQGERYAKSKGHAGEPIEAWYNMKGWSISADCAYDEASASPEVVGKIKNAFEFLMPYYEMMNQVYHSAD